MPNVRKLIPVFEEARRLLALPDNDFSWSSWEDTPDALEEVDHLLSTLRSGVLPAAWTMGTLFAPTGPLQEVSLSSGWGDALLQLADRFDDAMASDGLPENENRPLPSEPCPCFTAPLRRWADAGELGMDSRMAEVSVLTCPDCGQLWLRYFYEAEAFTGSGRWYLGPITPDQRATLTPQTAKSVLESLGWYHYGGSYFGGRSGKTSGEITLTP
jgi:hypothetical protein